MSEELHPPETITSIILIRHGHTERTEQGRLYSDPQVELTERGREQAIAAGRWLADNRPDEILASTANRVRTTAELIASEAGMDMKVVEELHEWSVGAWEGRTYLDIKKSDPEIYQAWVSDPITNAPPGGESIEGLVERVSERLAEIVAAHEGKTVCLVTHAGVIRSILVRALEMPVRNFWRLSIPVGSISRVDLSENFATVHYTAMKPD